MADKRGPEARSVNRPAEPLKAEHVPYRGGSAVMEALAKGEVDYSLEVLASSAPHLRDGLSRGLAVSSWEYSGKSGLAFMRLPGRSFP